MVDKELLDNLREHRLTYQEIGEVVGVSKQRAHQLVKSYKTSGKKIEEEGRCFICKGIVDLELHHKDFNSQNNQAKNLLILCRKCHRLVHSSVSFESDIDIIKKKSPEKIYYTIEEMAEIYMVKPATMRKWARNGKLLAEKVGKRWLFEIPAFLRVNRNNNIGATQPGQGTKEKK